jgi:PAS domain S-box-containing protein
MGQSISCDQLQEKVNCLEKELEKQHEMAELLASKEKEYQKIFDSATCAFLIFNSKGRIVNANLQACRMYGYTFDEFLALSREDIVHPNFHHLFEKFKKDIKTKGTFLYESKDLTKDGIVLDVEARGTEFNFRGRKHLLAIVQDITERKKEEQALRQAFAEIEALKEQLYQENLFLKKEIALKNKYETIVGQSPALLSAIKYAEQVAETTATVMILGETGTGKELLAQLIHRLSPRRELPMVKVNCAALPPHIVESELFGHEKGAYTGAVSSRLGRFEVANNSTIFLDEIGELPPSVQSKLLRILQEGQFERVGSSKTIQVNVRIITATNRDLFKAVKEGAFREDLFYRLHVFPILMPPLRERHEDIPLLVRSFIKDFEKTMGKKVESVSRKSMELMQSYPWPGNIRELRNTIERAMILMKDNKLDITLNEAVSRVPYHSLNLQELERVHIADVLKKTGGRIRGKGGAAEILGIKPNTLDFRIKKLGIR